MSDTKTGTVKFFNDQKGFGFISPSNGQKDDFVHVTALQDAGIKTLKEGDKVEYTIEQNRGRPCAANLKKVG